jgi:hypothetical protein
MKVLPIAKIGKKQHGEKPENLISADIPDREYYRSLLSFNFKNRNVIISTSPFGFGRNKGINWLSLGIN